MGGRVRARRPCSGPWPGVLNPVSAVIMKTEQVGATQSLTRALFQIKLLSGGPKLPRGLQAPMRTGGWGGWAPGGSTVGAIRSTTPGRCLFVNQRGSKHGSRQSNKGSAVGSPFANAISRFRSDSLTRSHLCKVDSFSANSFASSVALATSYHQL